MQLLVSAAGGNGGNGTHRNNSVSLNTAAGNGNGGGYTYLGPPTYSGTPHPGTAGTGFIFNEESLGLAGGGGGGSNSNGVARGSVGGFGGVYLRLKSA